MKTLSVNSPDLRSYLKYIALLLLALNGIGAFIDGIPMPYIRMAAAYASA